MSDSMLDDLVAARKASWKRLMASINAVDEARIALKNAEIAQGYVCAEDEAAAASLHKYVSDLTK